MWGNAKRPLGTNSVSGGKDSKLVEANVVDIQGWNFWIGELLTEAANNSTLGTEQKDYAEPDGLILCIEWLNRHKGIIIIVISRQAHNG